MHSLASPAGGLVPVTVTVYREHPEVAPAAHSTRLKSAKRCICFFLAKAKQNKQKASVSC